VTLSQTFSFEAGHRLVDRPICRAEGERLHGHSYFVEITIGGGVTRGMIMDSSLLQKLGAKVVKALDHRFLNDVAGLGAPTLENLGRWIFERAARRVSADVCRVRIWRPSVGDCAVVEGAPLAGETD
jgi:6-pyruvoyltetrahydropterin/6-carboxytetrahydropterin synthase